jgi:signal transduction histidine kinase
MTCPRAAQRIITAPVSETLPRPARAATPLPPPWNGDIDTGESLFNATEGLRASDPPLALAVCQEALQQAEVRGDAAGAVFAMLRIANLLEDRGDAHATAAYERAFERAAGVDDEVVVARVMICRVSKLFEAGRFAEAVAVGQQGIEQALTIGRSDLLQSILNNTAGALRSLGEYEAALELLRQHRLVTAKANPRTAYNPAIDNNDANVRLDWSRALAEEGSTQRSDEVLRRARLLIDRSFAGTIEGNNVARLLTRLDTLVEVLLAQGQADEAARWCAVVEERCAPVLVEGSFFWGCHRLCAAAVEVARGITDAAALIARLRAIAAIEHPLFAAGELRPRVMLLLSRACEAGGDAAGALDAYRQWADWELRTRAGYARERARAHERSQHALHAEAIQFITHDLRGPLSAALLQLAATRDTAMSEAAGDCVRAATVCAQDAIAIANQALTIMRAEFMLPSALVQLDVGALVDDVCEQHGRPGLLRRIEPGLTVAVDRALMARALGNLIDNAFEHSLPGTPVEVVLERAGSEACIVVRDQGPGLAGPMRRRLFQRYATGRGEHGHGLGLALVARVARLHRARVEVDSVPGRGTAIAVCLPCIGDDEADPRVP